MNNTGTYYTGILNLESANDLETLEKTVHENPTSSIARFLLLDYYKKNNHPAYEHFSNQSLLYFNNHYWIQHQLSGAQKIEEDEFKEEDENLVHVLPRIKDESEEENTFLNNKKEDELETSLAEEETVESQNIENPLFTDQKEETFTAAEAAEEPVYNEKEEIIENDKIIENEIAALQQLEDVEKDKAELVIGNAENINETAQIHNEEIIENIDEVVPEPTLQNSNNNSLLSEEIIAEEPASVEAAPNIDANPEQEDNAADNSGNTNAETIEFEPLYTVDYFASQGIKIKEEALLNDKLGQQVKSFTAWLKSMKKLHPGKLPEQNEVIERIIQSSAEESNADAEVLTEAMAEVLIKQNKQEKAIEMYRKLSLLNPAKSTYFAAKIESIKTN